MVIDNFPKLVLQARQFGLNLYEIIEPYLASNEGQIIGLIDTEYFHTLIEPDQAVMSRFEIIQTKPLLLDEIVKIIARRSLMAEKTYEVYYTYPAILEIAKSAEYYFPDGVSSDKAEDILAEISPWATANNIEIIDRLKMELGIELHMIDGRKESEIISTAENSNMRKPHPYSLYIDVGGGSAEISWFHHDKLLKTRSFDIGTIRVLFDQVPLSEWDSLKDWLIELKLEDQPFNCICSGGNVNKLTKLFGSRDKNTLSYSQLVEGHEFLEGYSVEDRIEKMGLRADRADVIVPAAIIFKKIMKWGKIHELQAPKIGLADGLVVDLFKKHTGKPTKFV